MAQLVYLLVYKDPFSVTWLWVFVPSILDPQSISWKNTPWKINMEPENEGLEDDFPLHLGDF